MNASTTSTTSATGAPPAIRKQARNPKGYRDLDELLDEEEELATQGLMRGARGIGNDTLDVLNVSRHARQSPFVTTLVSAGAIALLFVLRRRPRRERGRSRLLPLVFRFATSTIFGGAVNRLIKGKPWSLR